MTTRLLFLTIIAAVSLGACTDLELPRSGFATRYFMNASETQADNCAYETDNSCSPAPRFCVARGYQPGTVPYGRCIASVIETLRKTRQ